MSFPSTSAARRKWVPRAALGLAASAVLSGCGGSSSSSAAPTGAAAADALTTATPVKHIVVIFNENVSFDHYFATYPSAANPPGEPAFTPASGTPAANTLATPLAPSSWATVVSSNQSATQPGWTATGANLLTANPNVNATNLAAEAGLTTAPGPFRLDRTQASTADQSHNYNTEQKAFDGTGGVPAMDLFPTDVGSVASHASDPFADIESPANTRAVDLGYFDGNTVTAMWNYAQHYAMSDNAYGTTFGPSAVGAINLVSGQTNGVVATNNAQTFSYYPTGDGPAGASGSGTFTGAGYISADGNGGATVVGDPQPLGDVCVTRGAVQLGGKNIGDLLNAQNVSWGWFQGGFDLTVTNDNGTTGCARTTLSTVTGVSENDYVVHHSAFQFYASTSNPTHARPSSVSAIGNSYAANGTTLDPANHNYDIHDFFDAVTAGNFPAVNFLKAPGYQDGHAGYSDPLDEQVFVTTVINFLQKQPDWASTVVVIAYDDSDGWYDHQASPVVNASLLNESVTTAGAAGSPDLLASLTLTNGTAITSNLGDWLNGEGSCTTGATGTATTAQLTDGLNGTTAVQGRCGHGPRLPFLVISPFAKVNYVDHTLIDQSSILRFVEDNWLGSQRIAGSFDALAGVITNMLDFTAGANAGPTPVTLDPTTGLPASACTTCS